MSRFAKSFLLRKDVLFISLATFLFLLGLNGYLIYMTHGSGTIIEKVSRAAGQRDAQGQRMSQGLFVVTDAGDAIRVTPGLLDRTAIGDTIEKDRASWIYQINKKTYWTLPSILLNALFLGILVYVFLTLVMAILAHFRKN